MTCWAKTADREYNITGEVLSMIPLRSRRKTPDGDELLTRITEAMTRYECDGQVGIGMSEYLDQIIDGRPVGPDVALGQPGDGSRGRRGRELQGLVPTEGVEP